MAAAVHNMSTCTTSSCTDHCCDVSAAGMHMRSDQRGHALPYIHIVPFATGDEQIYLCGIVAQNVSFGIAQADVNQFPAALIFPICLAAHDAIIRRQG